MTFLELADKDNRNKLREALDAPGAKHAPFATNEDTRWLLDLIDLREEQLRIVIEYAEDECSIASMGRHDALVKKVNWLNPK
jgi:hypothetical protein